MGKGRIASPVLALAMGLDFGLILGLAGVEGVEHGGADQRPHRPRHSVTKETCRGDSSPSDHLRRRSILTDLLSPIPRRGRGWGPPFPEYILLL
ncbi:hypothetical protein BHM03_00034704 [Ensete ventricosum]|nr:hypothetical protein BHM03_00034704 [Ensete ventricosum]